MFSEGLSFALRYVTASPILHRRCGARCIGMTSPKSGFACKRRRPIRRRRWRIDGNAMQITQCG
ncbi:hypothetical protein LA76x_3385 [Lysobacter antibioticus]|uniref:Uncharacterized protein n=1 Tax=Lysobacter antibioticus TaxID=84531 RepID=A0A0S2FD75_LYSAN|nr:hypothetical protein LA76x_3385 [Lysobacter antibioticus]